MEDDEEEEEDEHSMRERPRHSAARLVAACAVLVGLWLVALPRLQEMPAIRGHIEHLRARQVDAAALFYTDLEPMPIWERRIDAVVARHRDAFWRFSAAGHAGRVSEAAATEGGAR